MRRATVAAILAVLAALASGGAAYAQADAKGVQDNAWNTSLDAASSAARYTGRPLLVFFYEDWCGYCEQVEKVLTHPDMRDAMLRFVLVKTTMEESEAFAKKHRIDMHHQVVMLDWAGQELARVTEFKSARDVALTVVEAAAANDLVAGKKLTELGYFGKAAERFRWVEKIARDDKRKAEAKKALDDIADRAKRQLEVIRTMVRKHRFEDALDAVNAFIRDFEEKGVRPPDGVKGPDPFFLDEAKKLRDQLKSGKAVASPDDKDVVIVSGPEVAPTKVEAAQKLLEKGMVYEWDKDFLDAVATYRKVVRDFPGTPAATEAEKRSKMFLDDPATVAALGRQQMDSYCRRMLEMGELYEHNGRDDEAIVRYKSILDTYPQSEWSREAQKRLNEVERRHLKDEQK